MEAETALGKFVSDNPKNSGKLMKMFPFFERK